MKLKTAHEISVVLVAVWGYTAVLLTGQFFPPIIGIAYAAAAVALYVRIFNTTVPRLILNLASCAAFVFALVWSARNLLDATVYLFMALQAIQLFSLRRIEECRWNYTCSLFLIIGSSVLTTSLAFGIVFFVFLVLSIFSLLLYTLRREWRIVDRLNNRLSRESDAGQKRSAVPAETWDQTAILPQGLMVFTCGLLFIVLVSSAVTFASVPRLATQNLFRGYGQPPNQEEVSAFDDTIEFGSFEKIQLDDKVALFAQPLGQTRPEFLRLRGSALDTFDGKTWRRGTVPGSVTSGFKFRPFTVNMFEETILRIVQPPGITNYLFADTFPDEIYKLPPGVVVYADPLSNSVWLTSAQSKELQYFARSRSEELTQRKDPANGQISGRPPAFLYGSNEADPGGWRSAFWAQSEGFTSGSRNGRRDGRREPLSQEELEKLQRTLDLGIREQRKKVLLDYLDRCTSLPQLLKTTDIRQLAEEWTKDHKTPFLKAMSIERHLRTEYDYSLEVKARGNFIQDFLFRAKAGHCEYFATSMAVLLRSLGIPARVVNGFYTVEWNGIAQSFTVRQRDAHSWVEVWLGENYGWMTFDPTPPAGVGRFVRENQLVVAWNRFVDAMQLRWYRYVVDFSFSDQIGIVRTVLQVRDQIRESFKGLAAITQFLPDFAKGDSEYDLGHVPSYMLIFVSLSGGILLLWAAIRSFLRLRLRKSRGAQIRFYQDLLRSLSRFGYHLKPGQTPREFADEIDAALGLQYFPQATEIYYAVRFAKTSLTREQAELIEQLKSQIKQVKRQSQ